MNSIPISINQTNITHANNLDYCTGSWDELYKVTAQFEYSATYFRGGKRNNESAIAVGAIILDFDDGTLLDKAIDMFKDTKSLIVTTKSHQVDKKGLVTDRFRVILYIGISIIDMEYYSKLMKVITRYYKSDIACTDPARYYSPNPNQLVYYSKSDKYFDITKFDEMINLEVEVVSANTIPSKVLSKKYKSNSEVKRIDLDLNCQVTYYQNGIKVINTLDYIINNIKVSSKAIPCHCFLNEEHEDKNPSCFIYLNHTNIYAKCVSCGLDSLLYKGL